MITAACGSAAEEQKDQFLMTIFLTFSWTSFHQVNKPDQSGSLAVRKKK